MSPNTLTNDSFFQKNLLEWYHISKNRDMPWKGVKDPYKIWLSEIILQQTRVEQGTSYYLNFIKKYPDVIALSKADEKDVFKLWEGLGYYNRCRNLLFTARFISNELKGKFPKTYSSILSLKGVGPYTAAAIASFAYGLPHAVVDGNVTRILSRFFGIKVPIDTTKGKLLFAELADSLLDKKNPARYNQAIMDFGATVCKPKAPTCESCPLSSLCVAFNTNKVSALPIKSKSIQKKERWFYFTLASYKDELLVKRRTEKDIWRGLYAFHLTEVSAEAQPEKMARQVIKEVFHHSKTTLIKISQSFTQQLTHQTIHASFIHLRLTKKIVLEDGYEWITQDKIKDLGFPRVIANYLKSCYPSD
jgi:A/G-specific adenine glycosylase